MSVNTFTWPDVAVIVAFFTALVLIINGWPTCGGRDEDDES